MLVCVLSRVLLSVTPWTVACQAPLSKGFSRQEYWTGLSFPSPEDLSDPEIGPGPPALQAESYLLSYEGSPRGTITYYCNLQGYCAYVP